MGFQFNGLKAAVTISGSVAIGYPSPTASQTTVQKTVAKAGQAITAGTGALLYTVTAGKTLYVTHMNFGNAATTYEVRDGTTIAGTLALTTYSQGAGGTDQCTAQMSFPTPLKFTAGVFLDLGATSTIVWGFSGWEE